MKDLAMSMNTQEMITKLKEMGLGSQERMKCMETYRDAGEVEAIEQAQGYVAARSAQAKAATQAANVLFGMAI